MTKLENLNLKNNKIKYIPNEIEYLTKLKLLNLSFNQINKIPPEIKFIINLIDLNLSYNQIDKIPLEIKYLTKLKYLYINNNIIHYLPNEIKYLINLLNLELNDNLIKIIPNEIKYLINLEYLYLSNNIIKIIPNEIKYLINLESLKLSNNYITNIPNSIIYCINLLEFEYYNNQINYINPIIIRFLHRFSNKLEIYNDDQNIHNHTIQESLFNSIVNIINQNYIINYENIINNIIEDTILTEDTKNILVEYCNNKEVHTKTQLTFEDLLVNVWTLINSLDTKNEIKLILNIEMKDSYCKCFTGRISRLINCLNGFTDLVNINISDNQQIGNIIVIIKNKLMRENNYNIDKYKELVIQELIERNFNQEIIDEWIKYIE